MLATNLGFFFLIPQVCRSNATCDFPLCLWASSVKHQTLSQAPEGLGSSVGIIIWVENRCVPFL